MAALTVQTAVEAGITPAAASAASSGGDTVKNVAGDVVLMVTNGGGSSIDVTITAQKTSKAVDGYGTMTKGDAVVSVAAGATKIIGPFATEAFNNSSQNLEIDYSSATSVTISAIKVPRAS